MKMINILSPCGLAVAMTAALSVPAAELGMAAPPLQVKQWINGPGIDLEALDGKLVVVEFWATYCLPCRRTMSHLTELQARYRDENVVLVGISPEDPQTVRTFAARLGRKLGYLIAADSDRRTWRAYMDAFDVRSIPHAFVIAPDRRIVWHGHPNFGLDRVIEQWVRAQRAAAHHGSPNEDAAQSARNESSQPSTRS